MHVRLSGDSKIVLRSECGRLSLCGPVMDWQPVQGAPRLSPDDRWDRLQPPRDPTNRLSGYRKWMDGLPTDCFCLSNLVHSAYRFTAETEHWLTVLE